MINVPKIIGNVVDSMRDEGIYTGFTQVDNTYTIIVSNELSENEWVNISDGASIFGDFKAINVTTSSFDIVSNDTPPSPGSYKSLEPFYLYGHRREIANRLLMKDKDSVYKYQKYPLFALRLPISETVTFDSIHETSLNIAILSYTDKNYNSEQRYQNVITPVLMPLYTEFLDKIRGNSEIMEVGIAEHDKTDRLFYGIEALEGNESYIFNDPLDGIELTNLSLKIIDKNCKI